METLIVCSLFPPQYSQRLTRSDLLKLLNISSVICTNDGLGLFSQTMSILSNKIDTKISKHFNLTFLRKFV